MLYAWLPYPDLEQSAATLTPLHLGRQRTDALTLVRSIEKFEATGKHISWSNCQTARMWHGHLPALKEYCNIITLEWLIRGGQLHRRDQPIYTKAECTGPMPPWMGDADLHLSHKSRLIQKNPAYYAFLWPGVPNNLKLIWPGEQT